MLNQVYVAILLFFKNRELGTLQPKSNSSFVFFSTTHNFHKSAKGYLMVCIYSTVLVKNRHSNKEIPAVRTADFVHLTIRVAVTSVGTIQAVVMHSKVTFPIIISVLFLLVLLCTHNFS